MCIMFRPAILLTEPGVTRCGVVRVEGDRDTCREEVMNLVGLKPGRRTCLRVAGERHLKGDVALA